MTVLPEPPAATAAGQANPLTDAVLRAAVDNLVHEARRDSTSPAPGRDMPPMSARTTEITRAVMYCSLATVPPGLIAVAVLVASEHANPTVIGMICAAPAAIAVPILAIARLIRRAGEAAPTEINQYYSGPVRQETHVDERRAVWQKDVHKPRR
ncbi:hypothetical protein TUSST3_09120 [Streptomyces sp. TUS-ST3]|uniref:hypothetical protein n=1 Tax=Streptomyces sp. TUS-ST3 TaxID=3025591 RepID=UPI0024E0F30E|nr:hypothetical protein [Streptomyces sp. TUS-ST3]GLP64292.1 hypothetical protein TUSST3_09120 [Streptomyces sp. TUS-ST3]